MEYYRRESGLIVKLDDEMNIYYRNENGIWIQDQTLIDMFEEEYDFEKISEEEANK